MTGQPRTTGVENFGTDTSRQSGGRHGLLRRLVPAAFGILAGIPVLAFLRTEPPAASGAVALFFAAGLAFPAWGLAAAAAVVPFGTLLAPILGSSVPLTEPLAIGFLAGWLSREAVHPSEGTTRQDVLLAAAIFVTVVLSSCAVALAVLQPQVDFPLGFLARLQRFLSNDYFGNRQLYRVVPDSAVLLEGAGFLIAAAKLSAGRKNLGVWLAAAIATSTAVVALVNVGGWVASSWTGGGPFAVVASLLTSARTMRYSLAFRDFNAAGSYLAAGLVLCCGLAVPLRPRWAWIAGAAVTAVALWLTGSRTAAVAALAGLLLLAWRVRGLQRPGRMAAWAILGTLLTAAFLSPWGPDTTGRSVKVASDARLQMAGTALRMFEDRPLFGVGAGRFYDLSFDYSTPELRRRIPRENAHNNFLQILAELGVVGLASFVCLLGVVFRRSLWSPQQENEPCKQAGTRVAVAASLAGFLLSCLAGHPLLIIEVAFSFWLALGALAALMPPSSPLWQDSRHPTTPSRYARWAAGVCMLALAVAVPLRARAEIADADWQSASVGFRVSRSDARGERYRPMAARAYLFVPSSAREVDLPLRLAPDAAWSAAMLDVLVDGTRIQRVAIEAGSTWQDVRVTMPQGSSARSARLDLRLRSYATANGTADGRTASGFPLQLGVVRWRSDKPTGLVLQATRGFPAPPGVPVHWIASIQPGSPPVEYAFSAKKRWSGWQEFRKYGSSPAANWVPGEPGRYTVRVRARRVGSSEEYEAEGLMREVLVADAPLQVDAFGPVERGPLTAGTPTTWRLSASGGHADIEYMFWLEEPGGAWRPLQQYGPDPVVTWTPAAPGGYAVQGWVRHVHSPADHEAWASSGSFVVSASR